MVSVDGRLEVPPLKSNLQSTFTWGEIWVQVRKNHQWPRIILPIHIDGSYPSVGFDIGKVWTKRKGRQWLGFHPPIKWMVYSLQ